MVFPGNETWSVSCRYLQRHDEELERLVEGQTGKGCMVGFHRLQHASKEDALRLIVHREQEQFQSSGFGKAPSCCDLYVLVTGRK